MKRKILIVGIILITLFSIGIVKPVWSSLTFQDLIQQNWIIIDDKKFYDFWYESSAKNTIPIPASGVAVEIIDTPLNPGFLFSAGWVAFPNQEMHSTIGYKVMVLQGGNPIKDISAQIGGYAYLNSGEVKVTETTDQGVLNLFTNNGGTKNFDQILFNPIMGPISVTKSIDVVGNNGIAHLSLVINQFSEVPVPATIILLASGLFGLIGVKLRFKR